MDKRKFKNRALHFQRSERKRSKDRLLWRRDEWIFGLRTF
jgi:hypothetical protein